MARPFNGRQAHENQAFLAALRRTGNAREAARSLGFHRSTMVKRRNHDAAFAAEWDAALALAHARLNTIERAESAEGEPHIIRTAAGRLQLRRAGQGLEQGRLGETVAKPRTADVRGWRIGDWKKKR
jgi:hypothetical protein